MSVLALCMVAVAAFHLFAAISHLGLFFNLGRKDEHVSFAALSSAWSLSAVGAYWQLTSSAAAEGLFGLRIELLGVTLTVLTMDRMLRSIDRMGRKRILVPAWVWFGVVLNLAGLFGDASRGSASLTWIGSLYAIASALGCLPALLDVLRHTVRPRPKRFLTLGLATWAAALALDFALRAFARPSYHLYEWATALTSLPVLYALIDRFGRTHEQLGARSRELRLSYDELTDVRDELVQKEQLAAIGELSAVIAHDIRNPLAVLRNATTALRRRSLPPDDASTLLAILDAETARLNQLIDELLVFARPTKPDVTQLWLTTLIEQVVRRIRDRLPEQEIVVNAKADLTFRADASMVDNTLGTMLQAAAKALHGPRALYVVVTQRQLAELPVIDITVTDRTEELRDPGTAMAPGHSGKASLGLAIAQRVVETHGGRLSVANHPDGGPHLVLTLPASGPVTQSSRFEESFPAR